jgi:DNA-binding NtrC family response regulator
VKPTVLVVDDNTEIRAILRDSLTDRYNVVEADDGEMGLTEVMVGDHEIDLVVTDLNMPVTDGLRLIENLPDKLKYIIISGYLQFPRYKGALKHLNPVAVLEKPFEVQSLRDTIEQTLS